MTPYSHNDSHDTHVFSRFVQSVVNDRNQAEINSIRKGIHWYRLSKHTGVWTAPTELRFSLALGSTFP
jgi:hypothetical protein